MASNVNNRSNPLSSNVPPPAPVKTKKGYLSSVADLFRCCCGSRPVKRVEQGDVFGLEMTQMMQSLEKAARGLSNTINTINKQLKERNELKGKLNQLEAELRARLERFNTLQSLPGVFAPPQPMGDQRRGGPLQNQLLSPDASDDHSEKDISENDEEYSPRVNASQSSRMGNRESDQKKNFFKQPRRRPIGNASPYRSGKANSVFFRGSSRTARSGLPIPLEQKIEAEFWNQLYPNGIGQPVNPEWKSNAFGCFRTVLLNNKITRVDKTNEVFSRLSDEAKKIITLRGC